MQRSLPILAAAALIAGCAIQHPPKVATTGPISATTRPAVDPKIATPLNQIEPAVSLGVPASQPTSRPSLSAIESFARARDELDQGRKYAAIADLERAIAFDAASPALQKALGEAYLGNDRFNDKSIAAYERAATLQPDDLDVQLSLGRQYLASNDLPRATAALRRALLTTGYAADDDSSALTDFFLASALQRSGYDQAALDEYARLLDRIQSPGPDLRSNPELNYLIARPEAIWIAMGAICDKDFRDDEAIRYYQLAADRDPTNYDLRSQIVRLLARDQNPLAKDRAADLVRAFDARPESVALLVDVYRSFGQDDGAVKVMQKLHADQPDDRVVLYAYADLLQREGQASQASDLLQSAARKTDYSFDLVDRTVKLQAAQNDWQSGAKLLVEASRYRPDLVSRFAGLWSRLLGPGVPQYERLTAMQSMSFPADDEPAKWFWIATLAGGSNRAVLADVARDRALELKPHFAPAFRVALVDALSDGASPDSPVIKTIFSKAAGDEPLLAQLDGLILLNQKKPAEAEAAFRKAIELGGASPVVQDDLVDSLLLQHQDDQAEKELKQIIARSPDYEAAYLQLIGFYSQRHRDTETVKLLESWTVNDPSSTTGRLLQARLLIETQQMDAAQVVLEGLLDSNEDDADVLQGVQSLYTLQGKPDVYATKLQAIIAAHPDDQAAIGSLVDTLIALHRNPEATRVLDAARTRFAKQPDALYAISAYYQRLDAKSAIESALQDVLKIDPRHPAASNDLGYEWIDAGRNADQAEKLVRTAVDAEPDNQAFLDSLGWVLYKRGRFGEAIDYLQKAVAGDRPDPVVLDHLGDALYRLNRKEDAVSQWHQADDRLSHRTGESDDDKRLREQLAVKLKQAKDGTPVTVAPTLDSDSRTDATR